MDSLATPLPITDESLLQSAAAGDFSVFQELVGRYQARVFGMAYRIVGQRQDAEDVTQQTFASLIEKIDTFRGESAAATWILRIATNHALKLLRKRRGLPMAPWSESEGEENYASIPHPEFIARWGDTPDALAQRAEVRELIDAALDSLDDKYRLVFVLRDIEGLSVRETAEALEVSEGAVKVRLLRARLMLREQLTRSLGDESTRLYPDHHHG